MTETPQEHVNSENQDQIELQPRDLEDGSVGIFTLHYHGSCSECHHFHRRIPFDVSLDDTRSSRFFCERCQHPIFGLGRTDTQLTLASQDSFPIVDGGIHHSPSIVSCCNRPIHETGLQSARSSQEPTYSVVEQSSAINEGTRITRPSGLAPGIHAEGPNVSLDDPLALRGSHVNLTVLSTARSAEQNDGMDYRQPWLSIILGWIHRMMCQIVKRIFGTSRQYNLSGFGFRFQLKLDCHEINEPTDRAATLHLPVGDGNETTDWPSSDSRAPEDSLFVNPIGNRDRWPSKPTNPAPQDGAEDTEYIGDTEENDYTIRMERLRNHRRDKTLRKLALQKRCTCTHDCHCRRVGCRSSDGGNSEPPIETGSRNDEELPGSGADQEAGSTRPISTLDLPQPDITTNYLNHLGSIFSADRQASVGDSSSRSDKRRRARTLTVESTSSSVSLHPSRPVHHGRSLSTPIPSHSPLSADYGSVVAEVFDNLAVIRQSRLSPSQQHGFAWLDGADETYSTHLNSAAKVDPASSPASNTS